MIGMKKLALGGAVAASIVTGAVNESFAIESGAFQYLAGASIGIPSGAAAPPGLYTGLETATGLVGGMTGNQGATGPNGGRGIALGSFIDIVPVVWSTGLQFAGANYSVAVIQPFVTAIVGTGGGVGGPPNANTTCGANLPGPPSVQGCAWSQMFINTVFQPLNLSWNLGSGWFTSVAFSFQAPDGTRVTGTPNPDFWTLQPGFGISYLAANWNASLNTSYNIYTASKGIYGNLGGTPFGNGYVSGNQFVGDFHALYKMGKWSFGPVGYFVVQTTPDRAGGTGCAGLAGFAGGIIGCANQNEFALGGLVGYDFGPVDVQAWVTDSIVQQNSGQSGVTVWSRVGFRLWAPEAAKPLVAKN
jgi:hypothetical protein